MNRGICWKPISMAIWPRRRRGNYGTGWEAIRSTCVCLCGKRTCIAAFGSIHPAMTALYCDGSVRSVGFSCSEPVFYRICKIDDGMQFRWPDE